MSKKRFKARGNTETSGVISKQIRNVLLENDNKVGSIPLYKSIDGNKFPSFNEFFDDSRTVIFNKGVNIHYPSGLPENNSSTTNNIATSNSDPNIITKGNVEPEAVTRNYTKENTEYQINAFNESNILIPTKDDFYLTSSKPEDVGLGFDQNLGTRTSIDIELPFTDDLILQFNKYANKDFSFYSDLTTNISESYHAYNSPMVYYDFQNKNWEYLGDITKRYSSSPSQSDHQDFIDNSFIGFGPSSPDKSVSLLHISSSLGIPISNFGFPFDSKFQGFNNNILNVSNYIDKPFLFEKLSVEFTFSSRGHSHDADASPFSNMTNFFILNQRKNFNKKIVTGSTKFLSIFPDKSYDLKLSNPFSNTTYRSTLTNLENYGKGKHISGTLNIKTGSIDNICHRDLVTFSRFLVVSTGSEEGIFYSYDKAISEVDNYSYFNYVKAPGSQYLNGAVVNPNQCINVSNKNITINSPVRIAKKQTISHEIDSLMVGNVNGGRDLLGTNSGRSFVKPLSTAEIQKTFSYSGQNIIITKDILENSPYLIMPTDNLIFGIHSFGNIEKDGIHYPQIMKIHSGSIKFKLYGTLLRNNEHVKDYRYNNLSSDNIRTSIIGNTFVTDTFNSEPIYLSSGSYIEKNIEGNTNLTEGAKGVNIGSNKFRGITGHKSNGNLGSFLYQTKVFDNDDIFYDSLVPNPLLIHRKNGASLSSDGKLIVKAGDISSNQNNVDNKWSKSFPFESKYRDIKRNLSINLKNQGVNNLFISGSGISGLPGSSNNNEINISNISSLNFYYGWSDDTPYGVPKDTVRGFKYGLLRANPTKPKMTYSYNSYGQVRDCLEQRLYSAFYKPDNTVSYPITKIFKDSQENIISGSDITNTYNISVYATSSKPYFE